MTNQAANPYLVTQQVAPNGAITSYTYKNNGDLQEVEDTDENVTQLFGAAAIW